MPAHLLLYPRPEPGDFDPSWIYRAVHAAELAAFDAVLAPLPGPAVPVEPSTLLAALAAETTDIGLVAQVSSQYVAPYNQARMLSTLDNLSVGRAGWRLVTEQEDSSPSLHPSTSAQRQRQARAKEFVTVLHALWESWDPDAVVADTDTGVYVDSARLHPIDHVGEFFRIAGPLNLPRSPQLHPPLFVTIDSAASAELARDHADVAIISETTALDTAAGAPVVLRSLAPDLTDPAALADRVIANDADGFVLGLTTSQIDRFVAEVLPHLRERGIARQRYETSTLRGHLGLAALTTGGTP